MRAGFPTALLLRCMGVGGMVSLIGCQASAFNPGRIQSVTLGTMAGTFHRLNGRWPGGLEELSRTPCPEFDSVAEFELDRRPTPAARELAACEYAATFPYETQWRPISGNLQLTVRQPDGRRICAMTVSVPPASTSARVLPLVRLRFSLFGCPGEGKPTR